MVGTLSTSGIGVWIETLTKPYPRDKGYAKGQKARHGKHSRLTPIHHEKGW